LFKGHKYVVFCIIFILLKVASLFSSLCRSTIIASGRRVVYITEDMRHMTSTEYRKYTITSPGFIDLMSSPASPLTIAVRSLCILTKKWKVQQLQSNNGVRYHKTVNY